MLGFDGLPAPLVAGIVVVVVVVIVVLGIVVVVVELTGGAGGGTSSGTTISRGGLEVVETEGDGTEEATTED